MRLISIFIPTIVCGSILWISTSKVIKYYRENFPGDFVHDRASWGAFGDYFGGMMNPVLGLLNLALLIYISYLVSRSERQLALYNLRHEAIKKFQRRIHKMEDIADRTDNSSRRQMLQLNVQLHEFFEINKHLFPKVTESMIQDIQLKCDNIWQSARNLDSFGNGSMTQEEAAATTAHGTSWQEFLDAKNIVLQKMQDTFK